MLVQRPGDWATILRVDACLPLVPTIDGRGRTLDFAHVGEAAMAAQSRWETLTSPPLPAPVPRLAVTDRTGRFGRLPRDSLVSRRLILLP